MQGVLTSLPECGTTGFGRGIPDVEVDRHFAMATYTAPKIIRSWWIVTGLLTGVLPSLWALSTNAVHAHAVFLFSALWLSFILFAWFWHGRYAKRIDVIGDAIHVLLQNGRELQFPRSNITTVRVGRGYAPKNVSIMTSNQLRIRLTSEISDFPDLLEELGYPEKENKSELTNTLARTRRHTFVALLLAGIILIVSLIQVVGKGEPPSTDFYLGFGITLIMCLIGAWGIYRSRKFQKERERKDPMDLQ